MGGSSTPPQQTSTTTQQLSPEQQQILSLAMPGIQQFAATVPQRYQGDTIAGFDPAQITGQNMALASAGTQANLASGGANASNFWTGANPWDPANNPALRGAIDASIRPITENYQQVVRPALRDEFVGAGQSFGGSRRGVAEGNAANSYLRNVGDTSSKVVQNAYDTNVNAQLRALALLPQTQAAQTQPALTTSGVGDVRQNLAQRLLDAQISGFNYDQLAPFLQSQELISILSGVPGGGTQTVATANVPEKNKTTSALGGAMSGASMGAMFGPVGMGVGAIGGGLLGYFG